MVLISQKDREVLGLISTSKKTAEKSLEQGILWEIHPETGKEIEFSPRLSVCAVYLRDGWVEAEIAHEETILLKNNMHKQVSEDIEQAHSPNQQETMNFSTQIDDNIDYKFIKTLEKLLLARKEELPEGSYTTHLFKSGAEKIRKKLGEEAIELVLAKEHEEIKNEAADLLYHLLVMLAAEEVPLYDIIEILKQRHKKGASNE